MPLSAGDKLGPYEILAPIGAGGMGEVWKARDPRLNRVVAIKRLKGEHNERFTREAQAIAALNHPHICQIYDVGPDYLVMEFIDGEPLRGPMPLEDAARIAVQIAQALEASHARGILHRDLKPGNVLVTKSGGAPCAKLLDFGLAKIAQAGPEDETAHTIEGSIMGTAAYMSPEQAQGKTVDERSDVFSFGAVLYEMLSGRRAFAGESLADTLSAVIRDTPATLDGPMGGIVKRCLAKAPAQRFASMSEVLSALGEIAAAKPRNQQPSIAVLPFANMSADPEQEYFCDGLAEEIINALANVAGLKVIARTSAFAFKRKHEDIRRIAEILGVNTVLEGSVRRGGNRLRITAQLIHAADGTHLWSQRYDREMTDIFAVQDEIAATVTQALELRLAPKPQGAMRHQPNLRAYEAYLRGKHEIWADASAESMARGEDYLRQAVALDPQWAEPHTQMGYRYFGAGLHGMRPMLEVAPLARAEAHRALGLAPSDPQARALLGSLAIVIDYDWREAEEQFRQARAAAPGVYSWMYGSYYLGGLGRYQEALQEMDRVVAQDPLDPFIRFARAFLCLHAGMWERAIADCNEAIKLGESSFMTRATLATANLQRGNMPDARRHAEEGCRLAPWNSLAAATLAGILTRSGDTEGAAALIPKFSDAPAGMVVYQLMCGNIETALDWYEKMIEQRHPHAVIRAFSVSFKPLRQHPRWAKLAKMMNLPVTPQFK